jgi:hypothetical protein
LVPAGQNREVPDTLPLLYLLVLGPLDDLVLELGRAVDELVAVPGDADDEVATLLRLGLGLGHVSKTQNPGVGIPAGGLSVKTAEIPR